MTIRSLVDAVRFFRAVPPVPPLLVRTMAVAVLVSSAVVAAAPARAAAALLPLLLLHLFATAPGFLGPCRRGYYDLLLTTGHTRESIALVHWASSSVPGAVGWFVLAVVEAWSAPDGARVILTSGTVAAMALVSTVAWSTTVPLPRFAGAVGWLLVIAIAVVVWPSAAAPGTAGADPFTRSMPVPAVAALVDALGRSIHPARLVGLDLSRSPWALAVAAVVGGGSWAAALLAIHHADLPLESAQ